MHIIIQEGITVNSSFYLTDTLALEVMELYCLLLFHLERD